MRAPAADYSNTLIVGSTFRPVFDMVLISREKLSFIVDATVRLTPQHTSSQQQVHLLSKDQFENEHFNTCRDLCLP